MADVAEPTPNPARAHLIEAPSTGKRTAWIVTFTAASDEPRVLRETRTLVDAGWRVVVCGYDGRSPRPPDWTFVRLANSDVVGHREAQLLHCIRHAGWKLARMNPSHPMAIHLAARLCFHGLPNWGRDHAEILRIAAENPHLKPDLVIAHDNHTCPPVDALARRYGARTIVDSQEYMLGVLLEDPQWMAHERPFIKVMQDHFFARADQVLAVSQGVADRLNEEQKLKRPVRVLRSLPFHQPHPFRPVGDQVTVLYHGLIDKARNLDVAIEAAALWTSGARLVIRGHTEHGYADVLHRLIAAKRVHERVTIEPPVPFVEMIARANEADIGYFVYGDGSPQRRYTLPNKFFEYAMAGLALCISDLPEMATLLRRFDMGVIVPSMAPADIAATIDALAPAQIEGYKRASLAAAKELCWEREQQVLLDIVDELCGPCVNR